MSVSNNSTPQLFTSGCPWGATNPITNILEYTPSNHIKLNKDVNAKSPACNRDVYAYLQVDTSQQISPCCVSAGGLQINEFKSSGQLLQNNIQ